MGSICIKDNTKVVEGKSGLKLPFSFNFNLNLLTKSIKKNTFIKTENLTL